MPRLGVQPDPIGGMLDSRAWHVGGLAERLQFLRNPGRRSRVGSRHPPPGRTMRQLAFDMDRMRAQSQPPP
jgi:hypothetical protein